MLHRSITGEQRIWLDRLPADLELPFLFGVDSPDQVAATLATMFAERHP